MTSNVALSKYMAAWVRMNSVVPPEKFSPRELIECFALLPDPQVGFEAWTGAMGWTVEDPRVEENEAGTAVVLSAVQGATHAVE
jgi:hypothetical protein